MNFPSRPSVFDRIAAKLQNGDSTLEDLKQFNQARVKHQQQVIDKIWQFEKKSLENQRQIYEFELQNILDFWENSMHIDSFRPLGNLSQQMLKFFTQEYDQRPDSQEKALKIYSFLSEYDNEDKNVKITEQQINLVFRMINRFGLEGIDAFYKLMAKIRHLKNEPENIIMMIDKCGSFGVIEKLFRINTFYDSTELIGFILDDHAHAFVKYVNHLQTKGKTIDKKLSESIHRKFLFIAKICVKHIEKNLDSAATQDFLRCIVEMYYQIPAFNFSFKDFYLYPELIEEKYTDDQDQIAKKLHSTGILFKLKGIYNFEDGWQNKQIIEAMNLFIKYVSIDQFETEIIPFLKVYFEKNQALKKDTFPLATMLINFIYTNEELNEKKDKKQILVNLFCESDIFNKVIDTINGRVEGILYVQKFGSNYQKQQIEVSLNLFRMIVLAFEIIENCEIHKNIYEQTVDLLKKSVKFVKQVLFVKNLWAGKVLDQLLQDFNKEISNQNVRHHPYNWKLRREF